MICGGVGLNNVQIPDPRKGEVIINLTDRRTAISNKWVRVPAGSFIMGSENGSEDEKPVREVYLDTYEIQEHEVTRADFRKFIKAQQGKPFAVTVRCGEKSPVTISQPTIEAFFQDFDSLYEVCKLDKNFVISSVNYPIRVEEVLSAEVRWLGNNKPVNMVSWLGAKAYCEWLGADLPTEAQWERAAIGTDTANANYNLFVFQDVCSKPKNALGLCDMRGSLQEHVGDWYATDAYQTDEIRNPVGPHNGENKVVRGYYFVCRGDVMGDRITMRASMPLESATYDLGFRCARRPAK